MATKKLRKINKLKLELYIFGYRIKLMAKKA